MSAAKTTRRTRRYRFVAVLLVVLVAALAGLVARMTVAPPRDPLRPSDAIVVLGGAGPRIRDGYRLFERGLAPRLFISVHQLGAEGSCPEQTGSIPLPAPQPGIVCFRPSPYSTRGEARYLAARARADHWRQVIVVVGTPQELRARLRVERCFPGRIVMVGVRPGDGLSTWVHAVIYELGADVKAVTLQRAC